ncbi:PREDICTED: uncharacterized protein LOC108367463 [Rhagoletis zephyria]|uniref:uncharacterized protein LOC108367463 n=1 Tax=Rhagoletis zephyria TaxID=28612 RepID=UPI0008116A8A|nr:PREDICTED: uncharacterized protein LOC108367463 [Rhagoletis zephyria]
MTEETISAEKYSLMQLKEWCSVVGLSASGAKASLAARLNALSAEARGLCPQIEDYYGAESYENQRQRGDKGIENVVGNDAESTQGRDKGATKETDNDDGMVQGRDKGVTTETGNNENGDEAVYIQNGVACVRGGTFVNRKSAVGQKEQNHDQTKYSSLVRDNNEKIDKLRIELLQKEVEVLKLKEQLLEKQVTPATTSVSKGATNNFEMLKEVIPKYDGGDDFDVWQKQLLHYREMFKLDDAIMGLIVHLKLRGAALAWYNAKTSFPENIDKLLSEMKIVFASYENKFQKRRKFERREWSHEESFANYFNEKCVLSSGLNLSDGELADYLVEGIPDKQLRTQAKMQNFSTASEVVKAFRMIELPKQSTAESRTKERLRCYNCNCSGHYAKDCRKPKREAGSCYACGEQGHYATNCKQYKKQSTENSFNA